MTSENNATEEADDDAGALSGDLTAPAYHEHTAEIVITLECGHVHRFTKPAELLSMYPGHVLTSTTFQCHKCGSRGPRLGPIRAVTGFRYDYRCQVCPSLTGDAPESLNGPLPAYRPFKWTHPHGGHDIAGYVIVRIEPGEPGSRKSTDVATIVGAQHFAHAMAAVDVFDRQTPDTATAHAIVFVYNDGCRHDRV